MIGRLAFTTLPVLIAGALDEKNLQLLRQLGTPRGKRHHALRAVSLSLR